MLIDLEHPPFHPPKKSNQSPNVSFWLPKNIEIRKSPATSSLAAQSSVTMNELESQENEIDKDNTKCFETDKQVMMLFDTVGNEVGDGGDSDGEGDKMLLLDCIRNKSVDDVIECDLMEANVNT